MKLLSDGLQNSKNPDDDERKEILADVSVACRTTLDILNDLLCFDKMENGILVIHKHEVLILPFISDCVSMFSAQAREGGVIISFMNNNDNNDNNNNDSNNNSNENNNNNSNDNRNNNSNINDNSYNDSNNYCYIGLDHNSNNSTPYPSNSNSNSTLSDDDTIFIDKFKMDQVLRNLISNALKFTPRGGSVSVMSSFVPDCTAVCIVPPHDDIPCSTSESSPEFNSQFNSQFHSQSDSHFDSQFNSQSDPQFNSPISGSSSIFDNLIKLPIMRMKESMKMRMTVELKTRTNTINNNNNNDNGINDSNGDNDDNINNNHNNDINHDNNNYDTDTNIDLKTDLKLYNNTSTNDKKNSIIKTCGKLIITVKDTGSGMKEEDYSRLFSEIVQFNPEVLQAGGGSGLGLWITKGIVDLHQGEISVHSEGLGLGTSFTLVLPMIRVVHNNVNKVNNIVHRSVHNNVHSDVHSDVHSNIHSNIHSNVHSDIHRKSSYTIGSEMYVPEITSDNTLQNINTSIDMKSTIIPPPISDSIHSQNIGVARRSVYHLLIVDDSPLNRKMLLKIFRAAGHTCDEAEDGVVAVAKVKEMMSSDAKAYSAILMDFVMPNMDGPTATRIIRESGYEAPIFGVTGNTIDSDVDYFLDSGADKVLAKPFDIKIFDRAMSIL